jgi:hypothetical protein
LRADSGVIVKLQILGQHNELRPKNCVDARYAKHRCDEAIVLDIYHPITGVKYVEAYSLHNSKFVYRLGEVVKPWNQFDNDLNNVCGGGVHYFTNVRSAIGFMPSLFDLVTHARPSGKYYAKYIRAWDDGSGARQYNHREGHRTTKLILN